MQAAKGVSSTQSNLTPYPRVEFNVICYGSVSRATLHNHNFEFAVRTLQCRFRADLGQNKTNRILKI